MSKAILGSGRYSVATWEKAVEAGTKIRSSRGSSVKPRKMHRAELTKWINARVFNKVFNSEERTVVDPRNLIPYRGANYRTIVKALMSRLPKESKDSVGTFSQDYTRITSWSGEMNSEIDAIMGTPWIWASKLFDIACNQNKDLKKLLKSRKSPRPGVEDFNKNAFDKFCKNIEVLQRTGGVTPYALPLMRCLFAIDHKWVMNKSGEPEVMYRLVFGRERPQCGSKRVLKELVTE